MNVKQESLLIVGCGDIGTRLHLLLNGAYATVGLRRRVEKLPRNMIPMQGKLGDENISQAIARLAPDVVVATLTPDTYSPDAYRETYVEGARRLVSSLHIAHSKPRLLIWVSSTSVYGQQDGEWVDEHSPTQPQSMTAQHLLEAENIILNAGLHAVVVRFSGIYGPGRQRLLDQVRQGVGSPAQPLHYTNRIHADDCAGVLQHLIALNSEGQVLEPVYLATDHAPVALHEVKDGIAAMLGLPDHWQEQQARTRAAGSKRCCNQRLLDTGYQFRYPTWREGYRQVIATSVTPEHRGK